MALCLLAETVTGAGEVRLEEALQMISKHQAQDTFKYVKGRYKNENSVNKTLIPQATIGIIVSK